MGVCGVRLSSVLFCGIVGESRKDSSPVAGMLILAMMRLSRRWCTHLCDALDLGDPLYSMISIPLEPRSGKSDPVQQSIDTIGRRVAEWGRHWMTRYFAWKRLLRSLA
jgi:hypothetical protein